MSDIDRSNDPLISDLRADMPPLAEEDALDRVRARALAADAGARRAPSSRRAWGIAGAVASTAVVLIAATFVLAPRLETAAFAREQAADALLLQTDGQVLHTVVRYTSTGWNEEFGHDARFDIDQRWSTWIDPVGKRMRDEAVNVSDGSLDGLTVRVDQRIMTFANNVRYGTGAEPQLIEWAESTDPFGSMMGRLIDQLRVVIADGSAKVTGSTTIDGEEYWIVEYRPEKGFVYIATMRKSDYMLKSVVSESSGKNGNGKWTGSDRMEFETMEQVDPASLPADFFSIDAVIAAAPPGTPVDKR